MPPPGATPDDPDQRESFETTHWSIVLAAGEHGTRDSAPASAALEELCRRYWLPLYAYARRRGHAEADAQDLVQGFFARILTRRDLAAVRREKGRFRSYLLTAFKHHLANDAEHANAQKRGGGHVPIALHELFRTVPEIALPVDERSPDRVFDQQWALALLRRVLAQLREDESQEGRGRVFDHLQGFLTGGGAAHSQEAIATELGMSEGAVKQAVFRLRQRYQKRLREEVAQTVATVADVEDELRQLVAALRG